jgi:hypothetical protein
MWLEGLGQLKKRIHLIGTRTRDLPTCSIVPQPTTLPRGNNNSPSTQLTGVNHTLRRQSNRKEILWKFKKDRIFRHGSILTQ